VEELNLGPGDLGSDEQVEGTRPRRLTGLRPGSAAQRLSAAAESMRSIVQLIGDITGQINLLAPQATHRIGPAARRGAVLPWSHRR